ncbi:abnormal spindle-like microcephaly-associated protein isoform X2 [Gouania willdenowi]|nr:abnormal spindle-like microcephaly-associated protein isoform X2 [Gouania willdenowi]
MIDTVNSNPGFLDFSPGRGDEQDKENDVPVLSLIQFTKPPFVSFGSVKLGTSKSALLRVENPTDDVEVEVTIEKIPSIKGFSVDRTSFTIQPESSHTLTVTWTPTEEGAVRELVIFNANGVVKHQAVLLGRANAPKRKKRSLWDSIKSRRGGDKAVTPGRKKAESHLKMGANRTFQVSRNSQYQRNRNRSPLASLNEDQVVRRSSDTKHSTSDDHWIKAEEPQAVNVQQKMLTHGNAPNVLLDPAGTLSDSHKALNKTLSPIRTPDTFGKLMPCIPPATDELLSLTDALIMIGSDLSPINTRPESPSDSCELSESLESQRETFSPRAEARVLPQSPEDATSQTNQPRLTFFISKKVVNETVKCVNSATVTKGRAPPTVHLSGGRTVKNSRRRLMEKTLELLDPGPNTPCLPVMHPQRDLSPSISAPFVLHHPPSPSSLVLPVPPLDTSSPLHCKISPTLAPVHQNDLSSYQCGKKRKSEEFLKAEEKEEKEAKKRTRVMVKAEREERKCSSQRSQKSGTPHSISSSSLKATKSSVSAQAKQTTRRVKTRASAPVKTSRVVAVAQSKLTFIRPMQTALPRHPMPFAAKNMFYDERWIEKQERGFTWWINYVLTPEDFKVDPEITKVNAVSLAMGGSDKLSVLKAPTKEEMSYSTYTARRKLNHLRRSACQLFTSEAVVKAIQRLELEVEARRLLVRKDRHLWKDIGERRKVLDWLLSYNPLWLRIGLETIYGELISLESNSDTLGLAMFVLHRLLWNPDIAAEFRHARVPHLYRDGHEEALSRFTLKKLLLLVCFLDKAKESRLIEHDPCLFCVDAEFKSSKDLLLAFSRDFLSGEGILSRHLGYLGFPVSHVQTPLDEFNFAVKNLAVDLKCGIRLVRVVELLVHDWSLSAKLRLPAVSRLQKVHNVDVALQELRRKGVALKDEHGSDIDSRDIVDGHREKTLGLLWKIIFAFQVEVILSEEQLRDEISFLRKTLWSKQRRAFLRTNQDPRQSPVRAPYQHSSAKISLLMDWIRTVCDFYSLRVENFTVAFSDGRVLCYLIHHYHPALLPMACVRHSTTQTVECSQRGRLELNCSTSDSDASFESLPAGLNAADSQSKEFKELLENEKSNFRLVNGAVEFLGGVPAMINPFDMSNTIPNEKVVMTFLSFMCVRLLDLRNETRAARVIQDAWRSHRLKKDLQLYRERNAAAVKIQVVVRSFLQKRRTLRENRAASIIQLSWRCHTVRQRLKLMKRAELQRKQHQAATLIQAYWRMFAARKAYRSLRLHTVVVQAWWRMKRMVCAYAKIRRSIIVVQRLWRAQAHMKTERERFLLFRAAAVTMQRGYRRWKRRKTQKQNRSTRVIQAAFRSWSERKTAQRSAAAVRIQSWYRMQVCVGWYKQTRRSAVLLQAWSRGRAQRHRFHAMKLQHHAAVVIQSTFRGHVVRTRVAQRRRAAMVIQRRFRAAVTRKEFVRMKSAAIVFQAAFRGKVTRDAVRARHGAATKIQAAFRAHAAQKRYALVRNATTRIQQRYRATLLARNVKRDYEALRKAAVALQAAWIGRVHRRRVEQWHQCAIVIQVCYRRHKAQREFRCKRAAAVVIQQHYRSFVAMTTARKAFLQRKAACFALQAAFRGMIVRADLRKRRQAVTVIQSSFRMFLCRKRFVLLKSAAVIVQCRYRAVLLCKEQRREYTRLKEATMRIQAAFRAMRERRRCRAATLIQARFRMHRARSAYLATKHAAIVMQRRRRAILCRDEQMQRFRAMKAAAVVIQAACRAHQARRTIALMHRAAAIIQRRFLTMKQRRRFLALRLATLTCQQRYRETTAARKQRNDYLSVRMAVVSLQAAFRGFRTRKQLQTQHAAAATIQSHIRKHLQRQRYARLRWAATVLQQRYRANRKMRVAIYMLSAKRNAVLVLQAAYRGMKTRRILGQQQNAAHIIQRALRAQRQRRRYLHLKSSAITVQRRFRAKMAAKRQKEEYDKIKKAVVRLQAAQRGRKVREQVARWHQAATVLQRAFRAHCEHKQFLQLKATALTLQRRYRANVSAKKQRKEYETIQKAAVVLQAAYRGQRVREQVSHWHRVATIIQCAFRKHREEVKYKATRQAVIAVQRRYRANVASKKQRKEYETIQKAALVLQAAYRGMKSRRCLAQRRQAATVLQKAFRTHCEHRRFLQLKANVLTLQRRYRANVAAKKQRKRYESVYRAAVVLQAAFRGFCVRREVVRMHRAAAVIQASFRAHRQQSAFIKLRWAACIIQQRFRAQRQKRVQVIHYQNVRKAVVVLQAAYCGMKSRRCLAQRRQAATVLQRAFRTHCEHKQFLQLKANVLTLQRRYRANVAAKKQRKEYETIQEAAVVLQAAYRGQRVREQVSHWHRAATIIQSAFRKYREEVKYKATRWAVIAVQRRYRANVAAKKQRKEYETIQKATVVIQAAYRGMKSRRCLAQRRQAATVLQRAFRTHCKHKQFLQLKANVLTLQRRYRANVAAKKQRKEYETIQEAAVVLQAAYRGQRVREQVSHWHRAATIIQSSFRKYREEVKYKATRQAVVTIQRRYQAQLLQRTQRHTFLEQKRCVIILQAAFRSWRRRREMAQQSKAATTIQAWWRRCLQRRLFLRLRWAALTLQRRVRTVQLSRAERRRQEVEAAQASKRLRFTSAAFHHLSATRIQRAVRAHWALEAARRQIHSVLTIQRWVRARQQRRRYLEQWRKVVVAQRAVKRWLCRRHEAARLIQNVVRNFLLLKRRQRAQQGIIKAQALWRGHCSRRLNDNPRLVKLRHRLREVSAHAREEDKLCNKTSSALERLLHYKYISSILQALRNLETSTRLSPQCCERLVESGATKVIFTLIRGCNRSVPCMDVITFSIQILLNLSKYHKTTAAVYSVDSSVETLLDLLQRYREKAGDKVAEKGGSIFTKACFLLVLLLQEPKRAEEVMKMPRVVERIRSIYRLTARKHKLDAERTIMKQKTNASINGSFFIPATPRKSRPVPKFAPDWVLKKDKLKDIVNPLRAIQMVAEQLRVHL